VFALSFCTVHLNGSNVPIEQTVFLAFPEIIIKRSWDNARILRAKFLLGTEVVYLPARPVRSRTPEIAAFKMRRGLFGMADSINRIDWPAVFRMFV
jgi:hypothetical protein